MPAPVEPPVGVQFKATSALGESMATITDPKKSVLCDPLPFHHTRSLVNDVPPPLLLLYKAHCAIGDVPRFIPVKDTTVAPSTLTSTELDAPLMTILLSICHQPFAVTTGPLEPPNLVPALL